MTGKINSAAGFPQNNQGSLTVQDQEEHEKGNPDCRPGVLRKVIACALSAQLVLAGWSPEAVAVVGQAERYDEFKEADLEEFHADLVAPAEGGQEMGELDEFVRDLEKAEGTVSDEKKAETEMLKRELLRIPPRDRFRAGLDGQYTYDSNIHRNQLRQEKGDSVFDVNGFTEFDLGGKKTDLRLELRAGKQWNIEYSTSDFLLLEERIRFRRKFFKKITTSLQSRLARHSTKTIEIDGKKIRYDSHQNFVANYAFSRKFSANLELNATKRLFTTEPFDQDSQWDVEAAPSFFWHLTPKSRIGGGYRFGASRIRTKTGDTNSHEVHLSYFGKVTRKSSLSFDSSFSYQTPRSLDTATIKTYKIGMGYIWQWTPKTQVTFQAIRSLQNSTSNQVSTLNPNLTGKTDSHFINDNINISVNSRLNQKLTAIVNLGVSHLQTRVEKAGDETQEDRQFTFPLSLTVNYMIKRWMQWRFRYTFSYRTGDAKEDDYRAHTLMTGLNISM